MIIFKIHNTGFIFLIKIRAWIKWKARGLFSLIWRFYHTSIRLLNAIFLIISIKIISIEYVIIIDSFLKLGLIIYSFKFIFMEIINIDTVFTLFIKIFIRFRMTGEDLWLYFSIISRRLKLLKLSILIKFIFLVQIIMPRSFIENIILLLLRIIIIHIIFLLIGSKLLKERLFSCCLLILYIFLTL